MKKLTEKHLEQLAQAAAFADIKKEGENNIPFNIIKKDPSKIKIVQTTTI
jgi:hypothetical protein